MAVKRTLNSTGHTIDCVTSSSDSSVAAEANNLSREESCDKIERFRRSCVLSNKAQLLLRRTSRIMRKRPLAKSGTAEPLLRQLKSLRKLVPYSSPNNDSCVIADALSYLGQLTEEIYDHSSRALQNLSSYPKVEVTALESGIRIYVSCEKRPGLMPDLLGALEDLGLVFEDLSVSNHRGFTLDAISRQVGGGVCTDVVQKLVLRSIM